jgi:hypothetical protein
LLNEEELRLLASLNERIQAENDPAKLVKLIHELNDLLENAEKRTKKLRNEK